MKTLTKRGKKITTLLIAFILLSLSATGCSRNANQEEVVTSIPAPLSAEECIGKNYSEIDYTFLESGFTNIITNDLEDLKPSEEDKVNQIENISIAGDKSFSKGTNYDSNTEIVINYHGYADCAVNLHVSFTKNLILNKYAVDIFVDGINYGELSHGEDGDFEIALKPGSHSIEFVNAESSSVKGEEEFEVKGDLNISYKINCESEKIQTEKEYAENLDDVGDDEIMISQEASEYYGKNYKDVTEVFKSLGFSNIEYDIMYDIVFGVTEEGETDSVSINGKTDFNRGDIFPSDSKIIIHYHIKEEDNPDAETESSTEEYLSEEDTPTKLAFVLTGKEYSQYYILDFKEKKAINFTTNEYPPTVGDIIDVTDNLYTIRYDYDDPFTEGFMYNAKTSSGILIGPDGFQTEFKKCSIEEAEKEFKKIESLNK